MKRKGEERRGRQHFKGKQRSGGESKGWGDVINSVTIRERSRGGVERGYQDSFLMG